MSHADPLFAHKKHCLDSPHLFTVMTYQGEEEQPRLFSVYAISIFDAVSNIKKYIGRKDLKLFRWQYRTAPNLDLWACGEIVESKYSKDFPKTVLHR